MNELSLFSGAGGGVLGSKILGWKTIGYVEYENYCQKILKQRIADGILDAAPIFGDIRKFISDGYAESYQGMVDILTGGFPCQPFSVAGKRAGEDDPRNMWPATMECIRIIRPRFAFLENVPGLLSSGYFGRVLGDLSEAGYDCRWLVLGADDVGANHRRKRLWILAYASGIGSKTESESKKTGDEGNTDRSISGGQDVADSRLFGQEKCEIEATGLEQHGEKMADSESQHGFANDGWWSTEPNVGRVAHGVASRVDRLKAIGNGQVPLSMAYAFSILSKGIV